MNESLRRTPLYDLHVEAGAKLVPFAGWEMPIQYPAGITAEHNAVRKGAGLFDVSHMGEIEVIGPEALDLVQHLTGNDAGNLEIGQIQYTMLLRPDGGIVDDLLVYRFPDRFLLVVNAANRQKDLDWFTENLPRFDARVVDRSEEIALIALQGPASNQILAGLTEIAVGALDYYHFTEGAVAGRHVLVSRTGYTGEDGFELYVANDDAAPIWRALLDAGKDVGIQPVGLGARDTLRLEMGYVLYGNDIDESTQPYEAGLGWTVKLDKGDFIASEALRELRREGSRRKLAGIRLVERGFPRPGYEIEHEGKAVGVVTSGTVSPSLGEGIGLGYLPPELASPGTSIGVRIRDRSVAAQVVRPPFYTAGSIRK